MSAANFFAVTANGQTRLVNLAHVVEIYPNAEGVTLIEFKAGFIEVDQSVDEISERFRLLAARAIESGKARL